MAQQPNKIRLIGGDFRRRLLSFPDSEGLRPTPSRVRETVFNWLGPRLPDSICLDLFAGSGALGFEAASRGASQVVMVEKSRHTLASLRANQVLLAASAVEVVLMDAFHYLKNTSQRFDIAFLDPPYDAGYLPQLLLLIMRCLSPNALVYIEARKWPSFSGWDVVRQDCAGSVHYGLLCQTVNDPATVAAAHTIFR